MPLSTFSTLNTAARGLEAARQQIAVAGQNTANAGTVGYTRQSVALASVPGVQGPGLFPTPAGPGQGVEVTSVDRSSSEVLNRQVRAAVGQSGFQQVRAEAFSGIEDILREPGDGSVSSAVTSFHAAWQGVATNPQDPAAAAVLLETATALAGRLGSDAAQLQDRVSVQDAELRAEVDEVNSLAGRLADLNGSVRRATASGGSANELLDARDQIAERLAALTGGQLRPAANGTTDFLVGGNALVSGDSHLSLTVTGGPLASEPVTVAWSHRLTLSGAQASAGVSGGSIAGRLSVLSDEGPLAQALQAYDRLATDLATTTNAVYAQGALADGSTGHAFFAVADASRPAATLRVLVTDPAAVVHGAPGAGGLDGGIADRIGQLGTQVAGPWTTFITGTGAASRAALDGLDLTVATESTARASQQSLASVDRDQEAVDLVTFQHSFQASARVLTAVDEMLDVLINRTGLVGR